MKIAITGGTGFVGTRLIEKLKNEGHSIILLTRNAEKARRSFSDLEIIPYKITESGDWQKAISGCDAVINLAGEPIAERWTPEYKKAILESRQLGTQNVVEAIGKANPKPQVLISASAIGYYGTSETATFDETSVSGNDFLSEVCQKWEQEAEKVKQYGVRLVIPRIGIVLGNGGALGKMLPVFKLFAGGPIGTGRQWFSWIHREDLVNFIIEALKRPEIAGTYNLTAPNPVKMSEFTKILGEVLSRPSWLPVPGIALEVLLGEGSKVVLEGQQVLPKATQNTGFKYQYPDLKSALKEIIT
ncbi:TIGR01777 family protein [Aphanothece hegewaldii CCALA 016]|uniref:TIGR01777 family protein n=1 Tax=Aphanothece hegewaldii CCALA 016 TaxID=2107694 RepID=A0A2T1M0G7_9CHRO|nr:TIGR01777 family oxidoreductase [Aphanothece hegewaldii]PSF38164.1 TIGR01777 family protein [Aphanothece hegewaldii CCALA 016]